MLFNSYAFLVFFFAVTVVYFSIPQRFRWVFLLAASYYFYACWKAEYALLMALTTLIDWFAARQMDQARDRSKKKKYLLLSLISNLGILFTFKYFNFFNASLGAVFGHFNLLYHVPALKVLLPVGISFYTFQSLSYTIDVYRGEIKAEKHLGYLALYVSFFPQLVAGPIERSTRLLPQFFVKKEIDADRMINGLKLILWGLFKKVAVADRLAVVVNQVYNNPSDYTGIPILIATYFFAFQIYCDFSGYSDIAIGTAQVLGYDLMDNFKRPYFAKSIPEFWKRWHISLSTWFRDYLYIPLGGNRKGKGRWYGNLFTVFIVSGLWHGANWTFILWGALHGFYLLCSIWLTKVRYAFVKFSGFAKWPAFHQAVRVFITFHLVLFGWIFFRANSLPDALYLVTHLFAGVPYTLTHMAQLGWSDTLMLGYNIGVGKVDFTVTVGLVIFMEFIHWMQEHGSMRHFMLGKPLWLRWAVYYSLILFIVLFGVDHSNQFIYFQF